MKGDITKIIARHPDGTEMEFPAPVKTLLFMPPELIKIDENNVHVRVGKHYNCFNYDCTDHIKFYRDGIDNDPQRIDIGWKVGNYTDTPQEERVYTEYAIVNEDVVTWTIHFRKL